MTNVVARHSLEILLVDDNPGDVRLTVEALKESDGLNTLHIAKDGVEATDFLFRKGVDGKAHHPDLILLDLNLPKKNGSEVLAEIKGNPTLRHIPVVILTSSEDVADITRAYSLHANSYVTKPIDLEQFIDTVKHITDYWSNIAKLPVGEMTFEE